MAAGLTPLAPNSQLTPLDLLLTTLTLAVVVWLVLDLVERRRFARPRVPVLADTVAARVTIAAAFLLVGAADAGLLLGYEHLLRRVVADTSLDLLHFSLHPLSSGRLAVEFALVLMHAAAIWGAAAIIRLPSTLLLRTPRRWSWHCTAAAAWLSGSLVMRLSQH